MASDVRETNSTFAGNSPVCKLKSDAEISMPSTNAVINHLSLGTISKGSTCEVLAADAAVPTGLISETVLFREY